MSNRVMSVIWVATVWFGSSWAPVAKGQAPARTAGEVKAAPLVWDRLAAESLVHAARSLGHMPGDTQIAQAGRIRALLRCAQRLYPTGVEINRQLIDLYEGAGELTPAVAAAAAYVKARPNDYPCAVRWIRMALETMNTADERVGFLKKVVAREELSKSIRAVAAAGLCRIYQGQGADKEARQACEQALRLDAFEPAALKMQEKFSRRSGPALSFETTLSVFRGNPRSLQTTVELARMLQDAAVYDKALLFYEHAFAIAAATRPSGDDLERLLIGHINAMLDAGQPEKAVKFSLPYIRHFARSLKLHGLMIEAYRALGDKKKADDHVEVMDKIYKPLASPGARRTAAQTAELAWFNLVYRSRPKIAIQWAKEAALSAGDDPFVQRVLAAVKMAMGEADSGAKGLTGLAGTDPYAAVVLAGHYFRQSKPDQGRKVLLAAAGNVRTGPAWRAFLAVANKQKVILPPVPHAEQMKSALKKLPAYVFDMGRVPEKFVSVKLTAPTGKVALGEPVTVTLVIKNISEHPVPLGQWGLFNPAAFLSVKVEAPVEAILPNLTLLTLPAPKYLEAGREISHTARVDIGQAEAMLLSAPLSELKLTVGAMLDPLQVGRGMFSSVGGIKIAPVVIHRAALFDVSGGLKSARYALGYIVRDLKRGSPTVRMRAARQTASLLKYVCSGKASKENPALADVLKKPVLLSMTRAFLQAPQSAVRAEMLTGLYHVNLDKSIISLLGPCIEDASPMVRMRLVELLVAKRTRGYRFMLTHFAGDKDVLVREMTKALTSR